MVLTSIHDLATGFEGCEKKVEVDFELNEEDTQKYNNDQHEDIGLRKIPRASIDRILSFARCTVISVTSNRWFDAYVLSESSLFIYPSKALLKTCGTTLLLRSLGELLNEAKKYGALPDFLQFSRSNFIFPAKQLYPHRAFGEETEYLSKVLQPLLPQSPANKQQIANGSIPNILTSKAAGAYILGPINGPRWHLYTVDWNRISPSDYTQQTLEIVMFNLDADRMKTFYRRTTDNSNEGRVGIGYPTSTGEEATEVSGIDKLLPGSIIDANLFTPCGYSCNGLLDGAYFTIHITPEPECSFVSFETNVVRDNYTSLVRAVIDTFKPGSWTMSLFVDEKSQIPDSRAGCLWSYDGYQTTGTTNHTFPSAYNATCAQFEAAADASPRKERAEYGAAVDETPILSPQLAGYNATLHGEAGHVDHEASSHVPHLSLNAYSYETVASMTLQQMRALAVDSAKGRFSVEPSVSSLSKSPSRDTDLGKARAEQPTSAVRDASNELMTYAQRVIVQHLPEQSFDLVDIGSLVRRFYTWSRTLSRISPVYHITSHVDKGILTTLSALGAGFACHTLQATKSLLKNGVDSERIAMVHPHLPISSVQFAREKSIELVTVHTPDEINNVALHWPTGSVLLLLASAADEQFGAAISELPALVKLCVEKNIKIAGVRLSSAVWNLSACTTALKQLAAVIKDNQLQDAIQVVDLGHQFERYNVNDVAAKLIPLINELFAPIIEILANAAPYLDENISGAVVSVLETRTPTKRSDEQMQKLQNGVVEAHNDRQTLNSVANGLPTKRVDAIYYTADICTQPRAPTAEPQQVIPITYNGQFIAHHNQKAADVAESKQDSEHTNTDDKASAATHGSALLIGGGGIHHVNVYAESLPPLQVNDWLYLPNRLPTTATKYSDACEVYYVASS